MAQMPHPASKSAYLSLWTAALLPLPLILGLVFWLKPWYTVGDDGFLLQVCDVIRAKGIWASFLNEMKNDIRWGMFRPIYFFNTSIIHFFIFS